MSVFWGFCAQVMFPTAVFALFLMLSGISFLERLGIKICCLDVAVGGARCNVLFVFVCVAAFGFIASTTNLNKVEEVRENSKNADVRYDDRYKMQLFINQRNWWISLTNMILWMVCWRVAGIMKRKNEEAGSDKKVDSNAAAYKPINEEAELKESKKEQ